MKLLTIQDLERIKKQLPSIPTVRSLIARGILKNRRYEFSIGDNSRHLVPASSRVYNDKLILVSVTLEEFSKNGKIDYKWVISCNIDLSTGGGEG